jgi:hypothetical protein
MKRMRIVKGLVLAALVGASVSCGNVVRSGRSPVYLVVDSVTGTSGATKDTGIPLYSDVITNVTSPPPCSQTSPCATVFADTATASMRAELKDITSTTGPSPYNDVTINRVHINYTRADGRSTPGVDVPYAWDAAATGTIRGGGSGSIVFEIVRHAAKEESPLVQLINSATIINTIAELTFYGRDQAGNEVTASATLQVNFGNFGDK